MEVQCKAKTFEYKSELNTLMLDSLDESYKSKSVKSQAESLRQYDKERKT